jgi:hypothetical protein
MGVLAISDRLITWDSLDSVSLTLAMDWSVPGSKVDVLQLSNNREEPIMSVAGLAGFMSELGKQLPQLAVASN